jgi:hypothetical protein
MSKLTADQIAAEIEAVAGVDPLVSSIVLPVQGIETFSYYYYDHEDGKYREDSFVRYTGDWVDPTDPSAPCKCGKAPRGWAGKCWLCEAQDEYGELIFPDHRGPAWIFPQDWTEVEWHAWAMEQLNLAFPETDNS